MKRMESALAEQITAEEIPAEYVSDEHVAVHGAGACAAKLTPRDRPDVHGIAASLVARHPMSAAEIGDPIQLVNATRAFLEDILTGDQRGEIAIVSSFGAESAVLLHLVACVEASAPVIFLDTGKHFAQTLSYRKKLAQRFNLSNVIDVTPDQTDLHAHDPAGDLWRRDADACCQVRKVRPLREILARYRGWVTGRKQFQGGGRIALPIVEIVDGQLKFNPLALWSRQSVLDYAEQHNLPAHPLVAQGFPSIGCWPCTKPVDAADDPRAGRWQGADKTECGIHQI